MTPIEPLTEAGRRHGLAEVRRLTARIVDAERAVAELRGRRAEVAADLHHRGTPVTKIAEAAEMSKQAATKLIRAHEAAAG